MRQQYYYAPRRRRTHRYSWRRIYLTAIVGAVGFCSVGLAIHSHASPHPDVKLQAAVDGWVSQQNTESSVYVEELTGSRRTAAHHSTIPMVTASTYKIFVAYAVLHEAELGTLSLNAPTRTGLNVQNTLNKMILQSDNDSAEALGFLVGWDTIDTLAADVGTTHTRINNYDSAGNAVFGDKLSTTADLALVLAKLQNGTLLNATDTTLLIGLMKNQVYRERIPAGVPNGIAVADKPGWLPTVENDAAIVYGPKSTYVLIVMTSGSSEPEPLVQLSQIIYNQLET